MAFGWGLIKKAAKALFTIDTPKRVVLDYRGQTGTEGSPLKKYPKAIKQLKEKGVQEVVVLYGTKKDGYSTMERVLGSDYLHNIESLEQKGRQVVSVDDQTGIVRRLKAVTRTPRAYELSDMMTEQGENFEVYDTYTETDKRNRGISYVVAENRAPEITDNSYRLIKCLNKITRQGLKGEATHMGRDYFETTRRELELVSNARVRKFDGKDYYVSKDEKTGNSIRYAKNHVDRLLDVTQYYLNTNGFGWTKDTRAIKLLTKKQLREALSPQESLV